MRSSICELPLHDIETITLEPRNLVLNSEDLCVVLCTCKHLGIFLYGVDSLPSARARKSNRVTPSARESINDNGFLGW